MDDGDKSLVCLKVVQQLFNKKLPMKPTTFFGLQYYYTYTVYSCGVNRISSSIAISLTYGYTDGSTSNVRSP